MKRPADKPGRCPQLRVSLVELEAEHGSSSNKLGRRNNMPSKQQQPKFSLGQTVATPGALDALSAAGQTPMDLLRRHIAGDWGDLGVWAKPLSPRTS